MKYLHVDILESQLSKKAGKPCGDFMDYYRTANDTTLILADGLGSGIRAAIAAQMCVARLTGLLKNGMSLRKAMLKITADMENARGKDVPYAVACVVRITNDGLATVLNYEMPAAVYITNKTAVILHERIPDNNQPLLREANCVLEAGEAIMLMSDGITQAGLGQGFPEGWTSQGVQEFLRARLNNREALPQLHTAVQAKAQENWKTTGDDCSIALAHCRRGNVINILTGPPANPNTDMRIARGFIAQTGQKIICGATTAKIVAKQLGTELKIEKNHTSMITPPGYEIEGIDLVTEGAVTLNQVYNVLAEDPKEFTEVSPVTLLCEMLQQADTVNLWVGSAFNQANENIMFRQRGIINRHQITALLEKKLTDMGKLVVKKNI